MASKKNKIDLPEYITTYADGNVAYTDSYEDHYEEVIPNPIPPTNDYELVGPGIPYSTGNYRFRIVWTWKLK